ncbi:MAG: DUF4252 domain-containing protein [Chryseolinea sp.]
MKRFIIPFILLAFTLTYQESVAQSQSFQTFKNKFAGEEDVHCFNVSGFVVRSVLGMAGEHEAKEAVRGIHKVRLAVVPRDAFEAQNVSVKGFRRILHQDNFDEMMSFRENGDAVTVFSNSPSHHNDQCYMMLVESDDEIVLIEILGHVNEAYFKNLVKVQSQRT